MFSYKLGLNDSEEKIQKYEELWSKIGCLIRSITKNSDGYDEKYMNIKFNWDSELPLIKRYKFLA